MKIIQMTLCENVIMIREVRFWYHEYQISMYVMVKYTVCSSSFGILMISFRGIFGSGYIRLQAIFSYHLTKTILL